MLLQINSEDEVIIPAPYWVSYSEIIKLAEGKTVLLKAGIERDFKVSAEDIEKAINDIKDTYKKNGNKYQFYKIEESRVAITHTYQRLEEYKPRPNQRQTIEKFKKAIDSGRKNLLMYAVMRFGKSFTSMFI